jgi:hypothetical protein
MIYHYSPTAKAKVKKTENTKHCGGYATTGISHTAGRKTAKLYNHFGKQFGSFIES